VSMQTTHAHAHATPSAHSANHKFPTAVTMKLPYKHARRPAGHPLSSCPYPTLRLSYQYLLHHSYTTPPALVHLSVAVDPQSRPSNISLANSILNIRHTRKHPVHPVHPVPCRRGAAAMWCMRTRHQPRPGLPLSANQVRSYHGLVFASIHDTLLLSHKKHPSCGRGRGGVHVHEAT
jgi:hypothetical protein